MELKKSKTDEGPYSIFYVTIGEYRIGWFGYNGGTKLWQCHVGMFHRSWTGTADTPEEATQMIIDMATMWIEDLIDG